MANEWKDWFEIVTDPDDPSHVVLKRLSENEAKEAYVEQLRQFYEQHFGFRQIADQFLDQLAVGLNEFTEQIGDSKAEARERSRRDVQTKRREMRRRKGQL